MSTPADAQLNRLVQELADVDARAAALAASCTREQWQSRHPRGGWSASECVQHLVISADAMLVRIDDAIAQGHARGITGTGPFKRGLLGRLLIWGLEPPYRMRARTAAAFEPPPSRTPDQDVAALRTAHDRVRASLERARGLALDRLSIQSPFAARAHYNVYVAFALIPVHARRHLWQAEQTVAQVRG